MITKICGIKREDTLYTCENIKVNFFGMIFYKKSPRNIEMTDALVLQRNSEKLNINGVGVFVNERLDEIDYIINTLDLKYIQLHGEEDNQYINSIKKKNIKVIKKISIKNNDDLNQTKKYEDADFFLFDYKPDTNELPGGNAKSFDWDIVNNLEIDKPWFLSGGINFSNISLLTSKIHPYGIDLSSGVEKELGVKDNVMINELIKNIQDA